jgi:sorbose reductase
MSVLDYFRLDGKKAFVTGAAGGIGKATATALAEAGADVAICDIPQKMEKMQDIAKVIAATCGVKAIAVPVDVSDPDSVDEMIRKIVEEFGTIDIVHNNAGITGDPNPDVVQDFDAWKRIIEVNLFGEFLVGRAAASIMIEHEHGGSIINTASMSGIIINEIFNGVTGSSGYPVSKAGILQLTKAQAVQWAPVGIRVNSISPGVVLSGIHDGMPNDIMEYQRIRHPLKRLGKVEELQGVVVFLASEASSFMTGANVMVDGGYTII